MLDDGSDNGDQQGIRVAVGSGWDVPAAGGFVAVTGVVSMRLVDEEARPVVLPRRSEDITIIAD